MLKKVKLQTKMILMISMTFVVFLWDSIFNDIIASLGGTTRLLSAQGSYIAHGSQSDKIKEDPEKWQKSLEPAFQGEIANPMESLKI